MPRTVQNTFLFIETGRFEETAPRDFVQRDPREPKRIIRVPGRMEEVPDGLLEGDRREPLGN
jgi:hypothetical protein